MPGLIGYRRDMPVARRRLFFGPRTAVNSTVAAVVADAVHVVVDHGSVVDVVNLSDIDVVHRTVVEEVVVVPTPAFVTLTEIAKPVTDPAVETHVWSPIAFMEKESVAFPTPPGWSPQETDFRRQHPCARHPVVVIDVVVVGPVAGCPNVAVTRAKRLLVDGQRRRTDGDGHADLRERCRRQAQHHEREQKCTNRTNMHGDSSGLSSLVCPVLLYGCGLRGLRGEISSWQLSPL